MSLDGVVILGMHHWAPDKDRPFHVDPAVFRDTKRGVNAYQVIEGAWSRLPNGEYSPHYHYWSPSQEHSEDIVCARQDENWFWLKEPLPLFLGAQVMYVKDFFTERLERAAVRQNVPRGQLFAGTTLVDELYGRPVRLACATGEVFKEKKKLWYSILQREVDEALPHFISDRTAEQDLKKITYWLLMYTADGVDELEDALLRNLIVDPRDLRKECSFMAFVYRSFSSLSSRRLDRYENLRNAVDSIRQKFSSISSQ